MRGLSEDEPAWDDEPDYVDLCEILRRVEWREAIEEEDLFDNQGEDQ